MKQSNSSAYGLFISRFKLPLYYLDLKLKEKQLNSNA
jgi:hypothetical protein